MRSLMLWDDAGSTQREIDLINKAERVCNSVVTSEQARCAVKWLQLARKTSRFPPTIYRIISLIQSLDFRFFEQKDNENEG